MSKQVVDLLERIGSDAQLRHASTAQLDEALALSGLAADVRSALLSGDSRRLADLLGAGSNVCCIVHAPDEEPADDEEEEDESEEEDEQDTVSSRRRAVRRAATSC